MLSVGGTGRRDDGKHLKKTVKQGCCGSGRNLNCILLLIYDGRQHTVLLSRRTARLQCPRGSDLSHSWSVRLGVHPHSAVSVCTLHYAPSVGDSP